MGLFLAVALQAVALLGRYQVAALCRQEVEEKCYHLETWSWVHTAHWQATAKHVY